MYWWMLQGWWSVSVKKRGSGGLSVLTYNLKATWKNSQRICDKDSNYKNNKITQSSS